jgi:hypothetical protein
MIVYQSTKDGFLDDTFNREIEDVVLASFKARTGHLVAKSEIRAWKESLLAMGKVLHSCAVPGNAGVAIEYGMVNAWKPLGDRLQLVQSAKNGKNALDFHIAYFLGVLREQDVAAGRKSICIVVTGDGGFDALFDFMRGGGCAIDKAGSIPEALALAAKIQAQAEKESEASPTEKPVSPRAKLAEEDVAKIVAAFVAYPKNRPGTRKKLEPYVLTQLGNKVTTAVAQALVKQLIKRGLVTFDGEKVKYTLPTAT